jgi:hypothetical protein
MRVGPSTRLAALMSCWALGIPEAFAQATRDAAACSALTSLKIPGLELSITKAEWFAAGSPPPRGGHGGKL